MQSKPMGQSDSTLGSLLNMYGYGDSEGLLAAGEGGEEMMETKLLRARHELITAVKAGSGDVSQALNVLLDLRCPVSMKYAQLNIRDLLRDNCQSTDQLKTIPTALSMLEKYGRHLLKPPSARVSQWRQINFNNAIFKDRVLPMQGALELVQQMGYSHPTDEGLLFAEEEPNPEVTSQLVADLVLARAEIERYLVGRHPHPQTLHALLPENTVDQTVLHWENSAPAEASMANANSSASSSFFSCSSPLFNTPTPVSTSAEGEVEKAESEQALEGLPTTETAVGEVNQTMSSSQLDDSLQKACDICGETAASLWCGLCDNKQLCGVCDDMWHKHPKRQNHSRQPMASLPSPSSAPPQDAIRGPFGIRALTSLSGGERPPTPVSSSGQSRTPPPPGPSRTPPPQQIEGEAYSSPTAALQGAGSQQAGGFQVTPSSPTASMYQRHQQQLQHYQQQQRLQQQQQQQEQQQQRLMQQQQQDFGFSTAGGEYHHQHQHQQRVPPAAGPYGQNVVAAEGGTNPRSMYPSVAVNPAYQPYPAQSSGYPNMSQQSVAGGFHQAEPVYSTSYPAVSPTPYPPAAGGPLPPFPVLEPEALSGGGVPGAIASHQKPGEPDVSLKPGGAGGYTDMSLRHSSGTHNSAGGGGAIPPASIPGFGGATTGRLERRSSGPAGQASGSESSLLKTVLAETDYEKRAAKCDVRLLTLEEDLTEVETQLNDLMLRDEDVTECDDFRTLNRRKARLMKEHRALRDYRHELATLMASEPAPSDVGPRPTTQIFHPPPLASSSPSPSPSYPSPMMAVSTSPTGQQLGFSYPHQASQSPVNPQEPLPLSVYRQPVVPASVQSPVSYPSPAMQESAYANVPLNSGVDRSSILSQWQMMPQPPTAVSSPPSSSAPLYPPPRYQEGAGDLGSQPLSSAVLFGTGGQWNQVSEQSVSQSRARMPVAQEHGMPPNSQQHHQYPPGGPPTVSRQSPHTDLTYGIMSPGSAPLQHQIGFENFQTQDLNSQPSYHHFQQHHKHHPGLTHVASDPTPLHPPPRLTHQGSGRTHTPSPTSHSQHQRGSSASPPPHPQLSRPSSARAMEVPNQQWECTHCTFINEPGTRVCSVCDRTSDNPTLIFNSANTTATATGPPSSPPPPPSAPQQSSQYQFPASAGQQSSTVMFAGGEGVSVGLVETGAPALSMQQLAQMERTLAEEQDQVYQEKKEAHKQFNQSLASSLSSSSTTNTSTTTTTTHTPTAPPSTTSTSEPVTAPPPLPPRIHPPRPPPTSSNKEGSSVDREANPVTSSSSPSSSSQPGPLGGRDSPHVNSLESSMLLLGEEGEDFSMTMERFQEKKHVKQIQLDGADLMHFVKTCDREGYSVEELEAALRQNKGNTQDALQWLHKDWAKLVQVVIASTKAEGQRLDHNDIGELSAHEAKVALCQAGGDMMAAVKSCVAKRKELYQRLNPNGSYAREEVLQSMLQCQGEEDATRHTLHSALLTPFLQRVWSNQDTQDGGGAGGTLLQMSELSNDRSCQSVSTSVISHPDFQSTLMDQSIDRERRIRMILVEGKLKSWGRAEMVIKLLDIDLPKTYPPPSPGAVGGGGGLGDQALPYSLEDVVEAVRNCRDRQSARVYLTQECSTCFSNYPMSKIRNLNFCQCKMCQTCLKQNFEVVIREKHVRHWTCPICGQPDLNNAEVASEYLAFLAMLLQTQVDREVYELFETKVRDWHLQKDPNFRWCAHCGNGFIADEAQLRMVCPHCHAKTCYGCKKQWEDQHEGLTCGQFEQWKIDNDPNNQAMGLARHLEENGIDCPSCKMRYALAKGGCMHFKCPQCGHEFCSGCYQPFYQRGMCASAHCKLGGLHAHHPRDCFFYLRDEDVKWLQGLLKESGVVFNTDPPDGQGDVATCPVIEQKEFDSGRSDESCGKETQPGLAGLCVVHYKEYLVGLINKNHLDPVLVMSVEEQKKLLNRWGHACPKPSNNESEANYRKRLAKFIKDKVPLPSRGP